MGEIKETDQVVKRKILFRGKTIDGVWVQGYFYQIMDVENKVLHNMIMRDKSNIDVFDGKPFQASYMIKPETISQFTGLYDKNGTPIFEGDILKECDRYVPFYEHPIVIDYKHGSFQYREIDEYDYRISIDDTEYGISNFGVFKVIGNIYDNPELLEVDDDKR